MSYGGYNQGGGYGQSNPYASQQSANPYASAQTSQGGYGRGGYGQGGYDQGGYGGPPPRDNYNEYDNDHRMGHGVPANDLEMAPLNAQTDGYSTPSRGDYNDILSRTSQIDGEIKDLDGHLQRLRRLQTEALSAADFNAYNGRIDEINGETMTLYRELARRIQKIKSMPESGSPRCAPQVGKVDRNLKAKINEYQTLESTFRKQVQEQMKRQYRIVRPEASETEVQEACEDTSGQQIFSQALMQSDRRGQAGIARRNVEQRHEAIQKIERQIVELGQLFQDMEALVVQQEPAVMNIEAKGDDVHENVQQANVEIDGAITKARSARRKKWMCLGIGRKSDMPLIWTL
ncbi:MAG: hypothetical protein M1819_004708 [Sarea resinae]|nr:MAG: hypothetical protein M1819_004708 [Sarea resinae]